MAETKNNIVTRGLRGIIGKQIVFKQYGNRTIVSALPDMSRVVKSKKQKAENSKFSDAMAYARAQMADPISKTEYKAKAKGMQRAHNVAITDYYTSPQIKEVHIDRLETDRILLIHAIDDFKVVRVTAEIYDADGVLLEQGDASEKTEWIWSYLLTSNITLRPTIHLRILAYDKPGNTAVFELDVSLTKTLYT